MNNGAFGENFPYSNFHDLNMDWIIKIAKDFLDQYTHIQEVIANGEQSLQDLTASGLEQLQDKADALEALLQQWYDTHSQDIANQLADALADLTEWYNTHSQDIANELSSALTSIDTATNNAVQSSISRLNNIVANLIETIPSDYTDLATSIDMLRTPFYKKFIWTSGYINASGGASPADHNQWYSTPVPKELINGIIFDVPADRTIRFGFEGSNPYQRSAPYTNQRVCIPLNNTYDVRVIVWTEDIPGSSLTSEEVLSAINYNYTYFNGLSKQVSDNLDESNKINIALPDMTTWTSGYINATGGASPADHNQWYSAPIPKELINGKAINVPSDRSVVFSFEGTNPFLRSRTYTNEVAVLPLDNTYDVRITIGTPTISGDSMTLDEVLNGVNWNATFFAGLSYQTNLPTIIYRVRSDGQGDYLNPREAFDAIYDMHEQYKEAIVYLYEGTYNLRDMFTQEEWDSTNLNDRYYWGLTLPPKTKLIGVGSRDNVVITGYGQGNSSIKSCLNFKNGGYVENIQLRSGNMRYAVHDDMSWLQQPFTLEMKNCRVVDNGSYYQNAYGGGTNGYGHYKYMNCIFESTNNTTPYSMHTGAGQTVQSFIEMIGCTFITANSVACRFMTQACICDNDVTMIGNKVASIAFTEYTSGAGCHFNLAGGANTPTCTITVEGSTKEMKFADRP